ncbi:MAG: winged helix-turn-helix domain-containing protein [Burkholderiales bacterium]
MQAVAQYRFGTTVIDTAARRVEIGGHPAKLGARAFDVLLALVERRDRVVPKNELLELVWPSLVVEENNLQVQVAALRKLLGPQAIATIPGRGYRFTQPLDEDAPARGPPRPVEPSAPPVATAVPRGNLPAALPPLFGRDAELGEVAALVGAHRVVSIVGAGGIGKTCLGLAVAATLRERFADGAWWVELAALTDAGLVAATIARVAGVGLAPDRAPPDALAAALADAKLLLALDNCEHLLDAVARVVEALVARAPGVRVLVTSQETLKVPAEHSYRLPTLAVPAADVALADAAKCGAVALFVERAAAADPRFRLNAESLPAIVDVCGRLDGIPLAIELAAARVPLLGVDGLRARLDERFRLLTAGARTVLRRHQTLRAALEWSHGLLGPQEQVVFRRVGAFAGGFTLELAQRVAADGMIDEWAVLDALGHLVDKSLVIAEGAGEPRYRLLETTRAFAVECLAAAGETPAVLRRHAQAVAALLTRLSEGRLSFDRTRDAAFAVEIDNVRAALAWATGPDGDRALGLSLAAHSNAVWLAIAGQAEGLRRVRAFEPDAIAAAPPELAARFWLTVATLGVFSADADCFAAATRAADFYRAQGNRERLFEASIVRAAIGARRREFAAVEPALAEARDCENPQWPPQWRARLAFAQWIAALTAGRHAEARPHAQRQAELNREAGTAMGEQLALGNVATCDVWGGAPARAIPALRAVIAELERLGSGWSAGHMVYNLAEALRQTGALDEALVQARRAYALLRREGDQNIMFDVLPRLAAARGRHEAAVRFVGYALGARARMGIADAGWTAWAEEGVPSSLAEDTRARLRAEGAALTEDQAFALALADRD